MIYLGIDPGLQYAGYGVADCVGQKIRVLDYGFLQMSSAQSVAERVKCFYDFFAEQIMRHQVQVLALETPFLGKNAQNFLKLGYLRGVLYLLAQQNSLRLLEFAPRQIKLAVTGYGNASKEQVAYMIRKMLPKLKPNCRADVTDALAVTLCGVWQGQSN